MCLFMSLSHIIERLSLITQSASAACFNLQKLSILPRKRFCRLRIVPRINSNCLPKEHLLVASCNGKNLFCETCLVQFVQFGNYRCTEARFSFDMFVCMSLCSRVTASGPLEQVLWHFVFWTCTGDNLQFWIKSDSSGQLMWGSACPSRTIF
jgi:hypothetical protein